MTEADVKIREQIQFMKKMVKMDAESLRELKRCRKTKNPAPAALIEKHECKDPARAAWKVYQWRHLATANLIVYGELRGKPHPVNEPERWAARVEEVETALKKL